MMKICTHCRQEKDLAQFSKRAASADGYMAQCKECRSRYGKEKDQLAKKRQQARAAYAANPEKYAREQKLRLLNPAAKKKHNQYNREWRKRNAEKERARHRENYWSDAEASKNRVKRYQSENSHIVRQNESRRRAAVGRSTPAWLTRDDKTFMQITYAMAKIMSKMHGVKYHVDHIYPIKGKTSCGLHVPLNLRVIPARQNISKGNRTHPYV